MGVRSTQLRRQALADLIHKPNTAAAEGEEEEQKEEKAGPARSGPGDAHVELVYSLSEDERRAFVGHELFASPPASLAFRRTIHRSGSSVYRVNGQTLSWERYSAVLELIGVSVRAKNFLVFQGDVESIAQKSSRQLRGHDRDQQRQCATEGGVRAGAAGDGGRERGVPQAGGARQHY